MQTKLRLVQTLYSNGQLFCHVILTLWWGEEVEKGVVGDRFGDRPDRATALVLLFLFDCFQCDVLALCPVNRAAVVKNKEQWKQGQEAALEMSNLKNVWDGGVIQQGLLIILCLFGWRTEIREGYCIHERGVGVGYR